MKKNILFLLILPLLLQCNKEHENTIIVKGKISSPNEGIKVEGARVTIAASKIEGGTYNPNYQDIASMLTNANGNYTFEFEEEQAIGYKISAKKDNYFEEVLEFNADELQGGHTHTYNFDVYGQGYIQLHVKNNQPYNSDDIIAYSFTDGYKDCTNCCSDNAINGTGMQYDETLICKTNGNQNVTVSWEYQKNGNTFTNSEVIFCPVFDTAFFEILY